MHNYINNYHNIKYQVIIKKGGKMYPSVSEVLSNMNWLNPFDYYDLMVALIKVFGDIQSGIGIRLLDFFKNGFTYGVETLPHHHPIGLAPIVFLYFLIFIFTISCLCIIAGFVLCLANMFSAWIMTLAIYVIFWRNPKLIELRTITILSAIFFILNVFDLW